jgi:hypothetical protein
VIRFSIGAIAGLETEGTDMIKRIATLGVVAIVAFAMGAVLTAILPAFAAIDARKADSQAPAACEATKQAWWAKQLHAHAQSDGARGVDLAGSIPALGIAHVTWSDGISQLVTVAEADGQWCAVDRLTLR